MAVSDVWAHQRKPRPQPTGEQTNQYPRRIDRFPSAWQSSGVAETLLPAEGRVALRPHLACRRERSANWIKFLSGHGLRSAMASPHGNRPASCLSLPTSRPGRRHFRGRFARAFFSAGLRERCVRRVAWLVLVLAGLGCLAAKVPLSPPADDQHWSAWRRTADGWERPNWVIGTAAVAQTTTLHPAVVGLLQVLVAVTALVALSPADKPRNKPIRAETAPRPGTTATRPSPRALQ